MSATPVPCATGCPFLACPTCAYQGGASERGTRHVPAGETACLPLDLGGGEGKMEGQAQLKTAPAGNGGLTTTTDTESPDGCF